MIIRLGQESLFFSLCTIFLKNKKLKIEIKIQIGAEKNRAKIDSGKIPFNPAVIISSCGNRLAMELNIQAIIILKRLAINALKNNFLLDVFEVSAFKLENKRMYKSVTSVEIIK